MIYIPLRYFGRYIGTNYLQYKCVSESLLPTVQVSLHRFEQSIYSSGHYATISALGICYLILGRPKKTMRSQHCHVKHFIFLTSELHVQDISYTGRPESLETNVYGIYFLGQYKHILPCEHEFLVPSFPFACLYVFFTFKFIFYHKNNSIKLKSTVYDK